MSKIQWRKVTKLAAKEFACFLMATDDQSQSITLEAMLGCRNPDDEPVDRIYFGWHAAYSMNADAVLQQTELYMGSCSKLGQWHNADLSAEESRIIKQHMSELLSQWQHKLLQAEVEFKVAAIASVANE